MTYKNNDVLVWSEPKTHYELISDYAPITRDEVWALLDFIQDNCNLTPAAKRMLKQGKRAKYNYRAS